tara:strand:+ start:2548 stop:2730 length:183 start_codon:yes stop_codon:yes gene_type:complete
MGLSKARQALDENIKNFVSPRQNPAEYNLNIALTHIVDALEEIDRKIVHVSHQVGELRKR